MKRNLSGLGAILLVWAGALWMEHAFIVLRYRAFFTGTWEISPVRTLAGPIALGALLAFAPLVLALHALATATARRPLTLLGGLCGLALGFGVTFGRHFASWQVRAPFVLAVAGLGAGLFAFALRWCARHRHGWIALAVAACAAWAADSWLLPRLYPAFHAGLFAGQLIALGVAAVRLREPWPRATQLGLPLAFGCAVWAPFAAKRLAPFGNMRMVVTEHAPMLGRGLRVGAWLAPVVDEADVLPGSAPSEVARTLDWNGRDIVLISVDALRADHLGAYGYNRPVSPNIDALSKQGVLFENAYCPTPHTSYSVTSMMTGKYMRPLLALGLAQDSETWAAQLRRYDYQTAAFYPPAVFFIDPERFSRFRESGLDFEYRKEEFAGPALREQQLGEYLQHTSTDRPRFIWVHLFEPHEPYVAYPAHRFGDTDIDAYDGEIAEADDGIGKLVARVRADKPDAIIFITADHGEEFGEHGGRYHGTTVYEEQVRVPLVIVGRGVPAGSRVRVPVQTIDLLPTALSALGIPRPARMRGRDLGPLIASATSATSASDAEHGLAFAETDDYELYAEDADRLVCDKRVGACSLFDVSHDRSESRDTQSARPERARQLRARMVGLAHAHGQFEGQGGSDLPEALRLGLQGDVGAAGEVATLLDDANVVIRRRAARVLFALRGKSTVAELRRALEKDEDAEVQQFAALALVRAGEPPSARAEELLRAGPVELRELAALAFAERGDKRGGGDLTAWFSHIADGSEAVDFVTGKELVAALGHLRIATARGDLESMLTAQTSASSRLRPMLADAIGAIGDPRSLPVVLAALGRETQAGARVREARAAAALGATHELLSALEPLVHGGDPMLEAAAILRESGALNPAHGGWSMPTRSGTVHLPRGSGAVTVIVERATPGAIAFSGEVVVPRMSAGGFSQYELLVPGDSLSFDSKTEIRALWAVRVFRTRSGSEP